MLQKRLSNSKTSGALLLKSLLVLLAFTAGLDSADACFNRVLTQAKNHAPLTYKRYFEMKSEAKRYFSMMGGCSSPAVSLGGSIHEAMHLVGHDQRKHLMISGEKVPRLNTSSLFKPNKIYSEVDALERAVFKEARRPITGGTVSNDYLRPGVAPTSAVNLDHLLNELNSYTQDAYTQSRLTKLYPNDIINSGVFLMMSAVQVYAKRAKKSYPRAFRSLKSKRNKRILKKLWDQASLRAGELCTAMKRLKRRTLPIKPASFARPYAKRICSQKYKQALSEVIGPVSCPASCLSKKERLRLVQGPLKKTPIAPQERIEKPIFQQQSPPVVLPMTSSADINIGDDLSIGYDDPSLSEQ